MTHRSLPAEQRNELGIKDNFLRMSIGLENANDLIKDLDQALKKAVIFAFNLFCLAFFETLLCFKFFLSRYQQFEDGKVMI
jgi:hypothetical protein